MEHEIVRSVAAAQKDAQAGVREGWCVWEFPISWSISRGLLICFCI